MTRLLEHTLPIVAVILVVIASLPLRSLLEAPPSFLLFTPVVFLASYRGGLGPGLLATLAGGVAGEYYFRPPYDSFKPLGPEIIPLLLFGVIGVTSSLIGERLAAAQREAARMAAESKRRARDFQTLFDVAPVGIGIAMDRECRHVQVNPAFARLLAIPATANASLTAPLEERPTTFKVMKDGQEVPPDQLPLQVAARDGVVIENLELDVVRSDGRVITLYEFAAPLYDENGAITGAVGAFLDITEQRQLYREAQDANRLKDQFLATLSHELRTPLNALLGWVQLLKSGQLAPPKQARALEAIERSAKLQAQLTADLLDVSRVITGKLRLDLQDVRMEPLIEDAIESLRPAAESRGLRVDVHYDPRLPALVLDPARMQQIVWNLLSNAIKFTPEGGRIDVSVRMEGHQLAIAVSDTGIGVRAEFLPFVFDRFRQADAGTTRVHGGLGLGLAIVRHIAELHGGTVEASSQGEGRGATFTVRIPAQVAGDPLPRSAPVRDNSRGADLSRLPVLVVDDDQEGREVVRTILESHGCLVSTAASVADAVRVFERERPRVVITDLAMPLEDGFALLQRIRQCPVEEGGGTPVVALTAHARAEDHAAAMSAGFQAFLTKPVDETLLLKTLVQLRASA